ncbi:hypothetical protein [Flavobacterium sp. WC2509]|uniref:hypothetical protein n=1 Tax=Flavobacterium sp. WC2509 TaxID=3461406 RepID=UPI0040441243
MKKIQLLTILTVIAMLTVNCSTKKGKSDYVEAKKISYNNDIKPIIANSCTPCHLPPQGRKEPLENYEHVKENIDAIIARVKLPQDDRRFMPPVNKKPALTTDEIALLEKWQQQNTPE